MFVGMLVFFKFLISKKATKFDEIFTVDLTLTGKSFSKVLILASTNPQYDKRSSIELPMQYMKIPSIEHEEKMMLCTNIVCLF